MRPVKSLGTDGINQWQCAEYIVPVDAIYSAGIVAWRIPKLSPYTHIYAVSFFSPLAQASCQEEYSCELKQ